MERDRWYENVFVKGFLVKEALTRVVFLMAIGCLYYFVGPRSRSALGADWPPTGIELGARRFVKHGLLRWPWTTVVMACMTLNVAYLMYAVRNRRTRRQRFRMTVYFILMATLSIEGGVLFSEALKRLVARFRPDFLSRCYPHLGGMDLLKVSFALANNSPAALTPAAGAMAPLALAPVAQSMAPVAQSMAPVAQSMAPVAQPMARVVQPAALTPSSVMTPAAMPAAGAVSGSVVGTGDTVVISAPVRQLAVGPVAVNPVAVSPVAVGQVAPGSYVGRCTASDARVLMEGRMSFPSTSAVIASTCLFVTVLWDLHMVKVLAGYTGEILIVPTVLLIPPVLWLFKTLSTGSHYSLDVAVSVVLAATVTLGTFAFYYPRRNAASQPGRADSLENDQAKSSSESFFMSTPGMPLDEPESNSHYSERESAA
ncbi:putative transmembrane protein [Gregarina niphandrodes]|uniref:Transmembrane protein n=1 Tax=Gregarina niphandrodes TaxID=110365 RepID=A0A023BAG9_GRENI|nr:putative transmembrane protein [Gregarina niphandrodes]EZG78249.1 putative transmembrane protein [Gregarina niphandrodes]|eukprot:XP_011129381.1 putative transmembrane protein [Gregarina niphandrodes]